jgi:hypothetical protein
MVSIPAADAQLSAAGGSIRAPLQSGLGNIAVQTMATDPAAAYPSAGPRNRGAGNGGRRRAIAPGLGGGQG